MVNKGILAIWGVLVLIASMSMYVIIHEATHAVRISGFEQMCFGFSEDRVGVSYHVTEMSSDEIFKEEIIANLVAATIILSFILLSFYLLFINVKGGDL